MLDKLECLGTVGAAANRDGSRSAELAEALCFSRMHHRELALGEDIR